MPDRSFSYSKMFEMYSSKALPNSSSSGRSSRKNPRLSCVNKKNPKVVCGFFVLESTDHVFLYQSADVQEDFFEVVERDVVVVEDRVFDDLAVSLERTCLRSCPCRAC